MLTIVKVEGGYALEGGGLQSTTVKMGAKAAAIGPGWMPTSASKFALTFIAFNLRHLDGQEATWLLDADCRYLAGTIEKLPDDSRADFLDKTKRWLDAIVWDFLNAPGFADRSDLLPFFNISQDMRDDLIRRLGFPDVPMPDSTSLHDYEATDIRTVLGVTSLSPKHIRACIDTPIDDRFVAACRTGKMSWTSPVDGAPVDNVRGFALSHILMVWRCVDERNSLVFFVLAAGFSSAALSLWIPSLKKIFVPHKLAQGQFSIAGGTEHMSAVIRHVFQFGRELIPFLRRPVSRVGHYTWPVPAVHVGHYHWNELTGLAKIAELLDPADYPIIFDLGGASGNCFYERTVNIYPEFNRVVDLSCTTFEMMSRLAYKHGIQPIKFAGSFVNTDVRNRIARAVSLHPTATQVEKELENVEGLIIIVGLRVENRTASNLVEFYEKLGRDLANVYGSIVFLVDGHNVKVNDKLAFISNQEQRARQKPMDVELEMLASLQQRLVDTQVRVISCVGMPLRENLAWLKRADFCVAPWGAGLAKYRWALNVPSYTLASVYCMRHKADMMIYASDEFMENPTAHRFSSEFLITDQPDEPVLIEMEGGYRPYYANYLVDIEGAIKEIVDQIGQLDGLGHKPKATHLL